MLRRASGRRGQPRLTRWETVGAWTHLWTPPKGVPVPPVPWRALALGALGTAIAVAAAAALIIPPVDEGKRRGAERRAQLEAERTKAELARLRADQAVRRATSAAAGGALAEALADGITRDARRRVAAGTLDGPILGTTCEPAARTVSVRPRTRVYKCLAATSGYSPAQSGYRIRSGYSFVGTVDFGTGKLAWCKTNPKAGEKFVKGYGRVTLSAECAGTLSKVL